MWPLCCLYLNIFLKIFPQYRKNILMEEHIVESIILKDGVVVTNSLLHDWSNIMEKYVSKYFKSSVIGSGATYYNKWINTKV